MDEKEEYDDEYENDEEADDDDLLLSSSSRPLSVTLVGRSLKLHSRRWKRDEKAAIKSKSALPHASDGSVLHLKKGRSGRRSSDGSWISFKWDHDLVRVLKLSSLH